MSGSAVAGRLPITAWPARVVTRAARDAAARTLVAAAGAPPWHRNPVARVHPTDCRLGPWLAWRERLARCVLILQLLYQCQCLAVHAPRASCTEHEQLFVDTQCTMPSLPPFCRYSRRCAESAQRPRRSCSLSEHCMVVVATACHRLPLPVPVCRAMRYNSSCLFMCWPSPCQVCCRTRLGRRSSSGRL